jgi:pyrimidine deaminase RibD-like protein
MIEPLFTPRARAAVMLGEAPTPDELRDAQLKAALYRATELAIESALSHGVDFPVGATAVSTATNEIVGRSLASDNRLGIRHLHAEAMALNDADLQTRNGTAADPDLLVVTLEPCNDCQNFIARQAPSIRTVAFGLSRAAASDRGLVNPGKETIFERVAREKPPFTVVQIEEPQLIKMGEIILNHTRRDPDSGVVTIDKLGLVAAIEEYNDKV